MFLAKLIKWGGLAAILGGVLGIVAAGFVPSFGPPSLTAEEPVAYEAAVLTGILWGPFVVAGLAGLCASVVGRPGVARAAKASATAGLALAVAAVSVPLVVVAQAITFGRIFFLPPSPSGLAVLELWGLSLATVLIGIAVLGSGGLGGWGLLPVVLGVAMLLGAPQAIIGLGWALLGYAMLSRGRRGNSTVLRASRAGAAGPSTNRTEPSEETSSAGKDAPIGPTVGG